jgi:hypothetical protein
MEKKIRKSLQGIGERERKREKETERGRERAIAGLYLAGLLVPLSSPNRPPRL